MALLPLWRKSCATGGPCGGGVVPVVLASLAAAAGFWPLAAAAFVVPEVRWLDAPLQADGATTTDAIPSANTVLDKRFI